MTRRSDRILCALAALALLVLGPSRAWAGTLEVSWVPPTEREDGTPLAPSEIAGYKIYYGTVSGDYSGTTAVQGASPIDIPIGSLATPLTPSYQVTGLDTCRDYYLVMTTYDTMGAESRFSGEVIKAPLDIPVVSMPQSAGPGAVQLSWTGPPSGDPGAVASYNVYYDTDSGEPYQGVGAIQGTSPINVPRNTLTFTLTGLPAGTTYYFVVEATCSATRTQLSAEVSGTTGAAIPGVDAGPPQPPPPPNDSGIPPTSWPDAGPPAYVDAGGQQPTPWPDSGISNQPIGGLSGGCAIAAAPSLLPLFVLLMVITLRRRRR